jgi:hypothetical protein
LSLSNFLVAGVPFVLVSCRSDTLGTRPPDTPRTPSCRGLYRSRRLRRVTAHATSKHTSPLVDVPGRMLPRPAQPCTCGGCCPGNEVLGSAFEQERVIESGRTRCRGVCRCQDEVVVVLVRIEQRGPGAATSGCSSSRSLSINPARRRVRASCGLAWTTRFSSPSARSSRTRSTGSDRSTVVFHSGQGSAVAENKILGVAANTRANSLVTSVPDASRVGRCRSRRESHRHGDGLQRMVCRLYATIDSPSRPKSSAAEPIWACSARG